MRGERVERARRGLYYGWVVVGVAFMVMFVNYGVRGTQTIFVKEVADDLGIGRGAVSLPFLVCIMIYAFLAPVTGRLVDRYGPRWVMAGGALVSGAGLWMCSRAGSLAALIFWFGVVFGVGGNGIGLVPSNTSVAMWFRRRLGTALGVATVGIGVGTMVLPRLTGLVQAHWGWRGAFQFLGYIAAALAVPAALLLRGGIPGECGGEEPGAGDGVPAPPWEEGMSAGGGQPAEERERTPSGVGEGAGPGHGLPALGEWEVPGLAPPSPGEIEAQGGDRTEHGDGLGTGVGLPAPVSAEGEGCAPGTAPGGLTLREAVTTPSFWLLFAGFVLIVIALYGVQFHMVPYATDRGIDKGWALWSVTVFGATSILGRFFFGWLSDRTREKKAALYPSVAFLFLGLVTLMLVRNIWSLMLFSAVFGFGFAAYGPVIPAVCAEVFGKANMGAIFGAVTTGGALGGAAGPYLTGFIFDHAGSYNGAWILAMVCVALSAVLFARVRILWRGP
ncbi:MAG: MFS transporter [Actinobacteria bacterium]|nr:MFS transporter [Actinomycetota bacterium]